MSAAPPLAKLSAINQLKVLKRYPALVPWLMRLGLQETDAKAIAYNTALVFYATPKGARPKSPRGILETYSLEEIAGLCALIDAASPAFEQASQ